MNESPLSQTIDSLIDDEKALALALAVTYWGMVGQNPNATPAGIGQVQSTADQFLRYLQS